MGLSNNHLVNSTPESNTQSEYVKQYEKLLAKGYLTESEMDTLLSLSRSYEEYEAQHGTDFYMQSWGYFLLTVLLISGLLAISLGSVLRTVMVYSLAFGVGLSAFLTVAELVITTSVFSVGYLSIGVMHQHIKLRQ